MAVGAASLTAVLVCQGRASADGRYAVGRFSDPLSGALLDPAELAVVDRVRRGDVPPQLVILGAGLDARAWRMPELAHVTVFEVDHPASQRDKLRRIGDRAATALRVVPVEVDLAAQPLAPILSSAGFDPQVASTWVWEGVVPYLAADDVRAAVA